MHLTNPLPRRPSRTVRAAEDRARTVGAGASKGHPGQAPASDPSTSPVGGYNSVVGIFADGYFVAFVSEGHSFLRSSLTFQATLYTCLSLFHLKRAHIQGPSLGINLLLCSSKVHSQRKEGRIPGILWAPWPCHHPLCQDPTYAAPHRPRKGCCGLRTRKEPLSLAGPLLSPPSRGCQLSEGQG